ncbi:hypothetical protein SAMD00019534_040030 [Acytostelium subglobosum LB1]|uniref:hypothetical protein n=1 Tax=Acytostelium subglobosum LB1 TaxID=1410327 RepID=UPI0006447B9A|nr:hypothetical protein SAMD00019534_040030 [Acytostelium subglobosum LB1]GAM20828.1 hypothetical protein SAMD00019534_040030 [Acytostelium subglobosum LB1]|eukprot:XP_012755962.1 hypothetical protein SAMD00019534_040030 [Acytostelium subglobosum LB1]
MTTPPPSYGSPGSLLRADSYLSPNSLSPSKYNMGDGTQSKKTLKGNVVRNLLNRSGSGSNLNLNHRRQVTSGSLSGLFEEHQSNGGTNGHNNNHSNNNNNNHSNNNNNQHHIGNSISPGGESPKSLRRATSTLSNPELSSISEIDKSLWTIRALKENPEIADLLDRIKPINRCIALSQHYAFEETVLKDDPLIGNDTMMQLILQHLQYEGLLHSRKSLESEANVKYSDYAFKESRLVLLIRAALRDSERIYSLTCDERQHEAQQQLEEQLALMGLLYEEHIDTVEDVNIYDEPRTNILYSDNEPSSPQVSPSPFGPSLVSSAGGIGTSTSGGGGGGPGLTLSSSNSSSNIKFEDQVKSIKAATLNNLVILLAPEKNHDSDYVKTFLLTYQSFTTNEKLLQKLIQRYQVPQRPGQSDDEWKKVAVPIQLRVVNVLKQWIKQSFSEFNDKIIQNIKSFIEILKHDNVSLANSIMQTLNSKIKGIGEDDEEDKKSKIVFTLATPEPKVPKNIWSQTLDIFDVDEEELARQLTLIDFEIFTAIKPSELLNQSWNKPKLRHRSPHVLLLISRFNEISSWVSSIILSNDKVKDRARIMAKLIKITELLIRPLNNYNTAMAILSGLNAASVHRLKFTREEMPKHIQQVFAELQTQLGSAQSYKIYRELLTKANHPCIPYLGICLTDLTFIEDGNPEAIKGFINFSKRRLIYTVISQVQSFQNTRYNLHPVYQISKLLRVLKPRLDDEDLYRISMKFEPRNKERSEIL